ncbi:MAG: hypothetical protein U1E15_07140 [Hyphomicrobiales bacterium]
MVLLPKFLGILPFDQAHRGAKKRTRNWATRARCNTSARRRKIPSPARLKMGDLYHQKQAVVMPQQCW